MKTLKKDKDEVETTNDHMKTYTSKDELEGVLIEKHVPVIKAPEKVKASEEFEVIINVGEKLHHPNTVEHHIKWIQVFAEVEERAYNPVHIATLILDQPLQNQKLSSK